MGSLEEQRLGTLRWIVLSGSGVEAFHALGRHMSAEIRATLSEWDYVDDLRQHVATLPGSDQLSAVSWASQEAFPDVWAELAALAEDAEVPLDDLALINFHADLGFNGIGGGGGCSSLVWRRQESLVAHNEDDSKVFLGRTVLLTLILDGQQSVTTFWKPGFVPSSTFTVTEFGMVWALNHLPVASLGKHPARHFVARGLQKRVEPLDGALAYLRDHPSAGGFAYNIGDRFGRVVTVEAMSGQYEVREIASGCPLGWHTNHGRWVAGADADADDSILSRARGAVLRDVEVPIVEPDTGWFARILAGEALPHGARIDAELGFDFMTLCTFVANLTTGDAVLFGKDMDSVTIRLAHLTQGTSAAQQIVNMA